jgi:large subunit ribosomal protein LX
LIQVKLFKIKGDLRKRGEKLPFHQEIRAVKKEDALQRLYAEMGSRHKARRFDIRINSVEEVSTEAEGS